MTVYAANCGDARAVLSTASMTKRITHDHRPSDPMEQKRIESSDGFVLRNRVSGILAVSRSFGDHGLKDYIICRPNLMRIEIDGEDVNDESFLILACDGLWDVMQDEEVVAFVRKYLSEHESRNKEEDAKRNWSQDTRKHICSSNQKNRFYVRFHFTFCS